MQSQQFDDINDNYAICIFIGATIPIQAADKRVLMEGHHDKGLVGNL